MASSSSRRERRPQNSSYATPQSPSSPNPSVARSASSRPSRARSKSRVTRQDTRSNSPSVSGSSRRSRSRVANRAPARKVKKEFNTPFDAKGLCHHHPNVQLAKKKLMGGWNLLYASCPKCMEEQCSNDDNQSVASRRSNKSSRSKSRGRRRSPSSSGRKKSAAPKFECPFNNKGYCHRHSSVRLAKKKITGGWKILQEVCVECVDENDNRSVCSKSSRKSHKSTSSRNSRSKSVSSRKSVKNKIRPEEADLDSQVSVSRSESNQKKMAQRMNYIDDNGEEGEYTGYVNSRGKPHGMGGLVYVNGSIYSGEWCDGIKVHGKISNEQPKKKDRRKRRDKNKEPTKSSSKSGTSSISSDKKTTPINEIDVVDRHKLEQKQQALKEYKELYSTAQVVKNMLFIDFFGDRGRYTGYVNGQDMPHGNGEITYDHGLIQGGTWTLGVLDEEGPDEGSIISCRRHGEKTRRRAKSKDP